MLNDISRNEYEMIAEPEFSIGVEEEYMLIDPTTGNLAANVPKSLMRELRKVLGNQVSPEFLQCQVEIGTRVCKNITEVRENLSYLRCQVAKVAEDHDLGLIAASTHPFAEAGQQKVTPKARYAALAQDLQGVVRRLLISGMHVHVGIGNDDLRIDLMGQVAYILPHLLALSTSSPFWKGQDTGLKSYRISVWDEMPRTGLPYYFNSYSDYQQHVNVLVNAGIIEDATKVWWDIRPSNRFPTLEMRISDLCTTLDDTVCIAAIYVSWLRMLYRLRKNNQRWRQYSKMLLNENRWRAHRYGIDEGLIDFGLGEVVPYNKLLTEMLQLIREDAEALGCSNEVKHTRNILKRGTSAHRQLEIYKKAIAAGFSQAEALKKVVDWLRKETMRGCR